MVAYVTIIDDCPFITFLTDTTNKVSIHKNNIQVQKVDETVYVTLVDDASQCFSWDANQAYAYGGRTIPQLYNYILSIISTPC